MKTHFSMNPFIKIRHILAKQVKFIFIIYFQEDYYRPQLCLEF